MKPQITYDQFEKIDIRLGTVLTVKKNEKARKPVSYTHLTLPTNREV